MKTQPAMRPTLPHLGERRFRRDPVAVDALIREPSSFGQALALALAALALAGVLLVAFGR